MQVGFHLCGAMCFVFHESIMDSEFLICLERFIVSGGTLAPVAPASHAF